MKADYQDCLEWEVIEPNEVISDISFKKGTCKLNSTCRIRFKRDGQYNLTGRISGTIEHKKSLVETTQLRGSFVQDETLVGFSLDRLFRYKFTGVAIGEMILQPVSLNPIISQFDAEFLFDSMERTPAHFELEAVSIQEWFVTGPTNVKFPRRTMRSIKMSHSKIRVGTDVEEYKVSRPFLSGSRDHFLIKYADTGFIVSKVPEDFGPTWACKISIEYRQSFGSIPDEDQREAITELVGFLLGNELLKIGCTAYNCNGSMTFQEFQSPWGDNVVSKSKRPAYPPIDLHRPKNWHEIEKVLNKLIVPYINQRHSLNLKSVLGKYWLAKYSPIGTNLPILSSAIETLAQSILKGNPKIKQYYISYKNFTDIIKEDIISIEKKLDGYSEKEIILNKLKGASQRGSNEKLKLMFKIINLPIGKVEEKAIKARNKMAHSAFGGFNDEDAKQIIRLTRAYETLFNRILLKIISYKGTYIDYYTFGHPKRNIQDIIPE